MDLITVIKNNKPNISDSSLKTYISNLKIIHALLEGNKDIQNLDYLLEYDKIIDLISDKAITTQKNYLVSIVVALKNNTKYDEIEKKYNQKMVSLQSQIVEKYDLQEKSDSQNKNWLKYDDLLKLLKKLRSVIKPLFEKELLNINEKVLIQQVLLFYLYSGVSFPPLRNDFADMKIYKKNPKNTTENYLVLNQTNSYFVLNQFKTMKRGQEIIKFQDKILKTLIKNWIDISKSDYLLINVSDGTPMSPNGITKNLNNLFQKYINKSISTSLLRSIFISNKYNDNTLNNHDKKELAEKMLHSKSTAENIYNKI